MDIYEISIIEENSCDDHMNDGQLFLFVFHHPRNGDQTFVIMFKS